MPESRPKPSTHYDLLGVKPTASPQQIRRAFRDLSKLYHPDTTQLPAAEATEKFQQLNEAYGVLSSPDRRWTYDKQVGYSRISVMQPMEPLSRATAHAPRRKEPSNMYLDPTDRPLSAGEIFALFILGLTFVACLVLVITVGLTRSDYALTLETEVLPTTAELSRPEVTPNTPDITRQPAPEPSPSLPSPPDDRPVPRPRPQAPTWL